MKKREIGFGLAVLLGLALISFVSAAFNVENVMIYWQNAGVFTLILPFLLVFALVYAILTKSNILGDNKGAIVIISLALGLLSLVGGYVPQFFAKISGNLAIGLIVLLAIIILLGLFYSSKEGEGVGWIKYIFIGVGILAFIFIVASSFSGNRIMGLNLWDEYGPALITLVIIAGIIALVIKWGKNKGG